MTALSRRNSFLPLIAALIALAWITLVIWERSPYGRYLDHGNWTQIGIAASLCRALPAGTIVLPALLYVGGWLLMSAAMMLPTSLPLLEIFRRLTASRGDHRLLMGLLIAGYLAIWGVFGLAAHLVDGLLQRIVASSNWLVFNGWIIGAGALLLAGAFQFSRLKYHCLDKCRTPLSFVMEHWRGRAERRQAFMLGVHHGMFCIGCCWAIMLLMFVVGTGSVGWMLALGAVMAVEKNLWWGPKISTPLGIGLIGWSAAIVMQNI